MEPLSHFFQDFPVLSLFFIGLLGLFVGSFLNVVIARLPKMLEREWKQQCYLYLKMEAPQEISSPPPFNLWLPRSHCPNCQHPISSLENIPIISYLFLKGRCRGCQQSISLEYPFVELLSLLMTIGVAWHFGATTATLLACLFTWALIAASFIDIHHTILPDEIILPLLWLGLLINTQSVFCPLSDAVLGAALGYLSLWSLFWIYKLLTGKEGMGYGDFKLFAVFGAWMGWKMLPMIIMMSSIVGASIGILMIVTRRRDKQAQIPFGPYLAAAGWLCLLWGPKLNEFYFKTVGLS